MASTLLDSMAATPPTDLPRADVMRESSSDSSLSAITVDASSNAQSLSSTPLTSVADSASISSTSLIDSASISSTSLVDSASISSKSLKLDTDPMPAEELSGRSRRVRKSVGTYNIKVLAGTAIHAPKKYSKDPEVIEARRRKMVGETLAGALQSTEASSPAVERGDNTLVSEMIKEFDMQASVKKTIEPRKRLSLEESPTKPAEQRDVAPRKSMRSPKNELESISKRMSLLGKRDREIFEDDLAGLAKAKRELKNLADTPEYAKIELKPVVHEVWSNGKLVTAGQEPKKKRKAEEVISPKPKEKEIEAAKDTVDFKLPEEPKATSKKQKVYLTQGLYAGQETRNLDWFMNDSEDFRKKMDEVAPYRPNSFMPLPMWHGQRLLQVGRDFQLPFDICSPLPPGQPKPEEWRKTSSNRFVGEAKELWKKSKWSESAASKCICTPESGCDEDCQNRIMLYECDELNCGAGEDRCTNRSFADLAERRRVGGKYRIGVEVVKTADRGYGVRSNRCFNPHQIIVEYTGEIITEDECDRRMHEDYKNNDCYYLMSFDQGMILDGTKGSIARFINHSCKPNCKMVKWYVGGKPRMALFAGDNPIMTGDELTYDYNFDPFSAKNVQECRCGSDNCRGVLGPKPKETKAFKETIKDFVRAGVKAGKRKLQELLGHNEAEDDFEDIPSPKKRKVSKATGVKRGPYKKRLGVKRGPYKKREVVATDMNSEPHQKKEGAATGMKRGPYKKREGVKRGPYKKRESAATGMKRGPYKKRAGTGMKRGPYKKRAGTGMKRGPYKKRDKGTGTAVSRTASSRTLTNKRGTVIFKTYGSGNVKLTTTDSIEESLQDEATEQSQSFLAEAAEQSQSFIDEATEPSQSSLNPTKQDQSFLGKATEQSQSFVDESAEPSQTVDAEKDTVRENAARSMHGERTGSPGVAPDDTTEVTSNFSDEYEDEDEDDDDEV